MSKSLFSRWTASTPTLVPTDASLDQLPEHEEKALEQLVDATAIAISSHSKMLPECDPWRTLAEKENERLRDEIHLRFLRFNALSVEKASTQLEDAIKWRAKTMVSSLPQEVFHGKDVGIPIAQLAGPTPSGEVLFISLGEAYIRKEIDHAKQETGAAKLFDYTLYDLKGLQAKRGSIILDFTNIGMNNVDLVGLKNGILIYLSYFPDIFDKILLFNYPKIVYGIWRAIQPLLDARTKSRIYWVENGDRLRSMLSEDFQPSDIPSWLGGEATMDEIVLFNGKSFKASELIERFK